eukprot:7596632-Alexandrium_andersonii.AAC.1
MPPHPKRAPAWHGPRGAGEASRRPWHVVGAQGGDRPPHPECRPPGQWTLPSTNGRPDPTSKGGGTADAAAPFASSRCQPVQPRRT